jgi:hypothetical protein
MIIYWFCSWWDPGLTNSSPNSLSSAVAALFIWRKKQAVLQQTIEIPCVFEASWENSRTGLYCNKGHRGKKTNNMRSCHRKELKTVVQCKEMALSKIYIQTISVKFQHAGKILLVAYNMPVVLRGYPQSLKTNAGTVPEIKPWPLPSMSFPIHYSLIILSFDVMHSEVLTASLNKLQINKAH